MLSHFIEGFVLQAGLILGLGAQNLFVLDAGIRKQRHYLIASVCSICDVLLIALGVLGAASIFLAYPLLKIIVGALGVAFLAYYAVLKLWEAWRGVKIEKNVEAKSFSRRRAVMLALAFSVLNPHVYLDTVVLIGGYATKFEALYERALFGAGAGFFSTLWFFGLATLSAAFGKVLMQPKAMRILSLLAGCVLSWLAIKLGFEVFA